MTNALKNENLNATQGKTFIQPVRWESDTWGYAAISAITQGAPVTITATAHGIPNGWRAAVVSAIGMTQINAQNAPPRDHELSPITVLDANTIAFNGVNASGYSAYISGGYLQYRKPVDISSYTARMEIKDSVGGTVLAASLTGVAWSAATAIGLGQVIAPDGAALNASNVMLQCVVPGVTGADAALVLPAVGGQVQDGSAVWLVVPLSITATVDVSSDTVTISIPATAMALLPVGSYPYDLEVVDASHVVTALMAGEFNVDYEITT